MRRLLLLLMLLPTVSIGQTTDSIVLLRPARVFDGEVLQQNWQVFLRGEVVFKKP